MKKELPIRVWIMITLTQYNQQYSPLNAQYSALSTQHSPSDIWIRFWFFVFRSWKKKPLEITVTNWIHVEMKIFGFFHFEFLIRIFFFIFARSLFKSCMVWSMIRIICWKKISNRQSTEFIVIAQHIMWVECRVVTKQYAATFLMERKLFFFSYIFFGLIHKKLDANASMFCNILVTFIT